MNKRILGLLLTGLIVGNMCSVTTFASQIDKAFKDELFKNKSFSGEILRNEAFEEKNIYKITITDENRDEVYEKLALTEYMKQMKQELDKDKKIVKQVIYIAPIGQQNSYMLRM